PVKNVQRKLSQTKESLRHRIESEHPILSWIQPWMRDRMHEAEENFIEECEYGAHEEALALCSHQNFTISATSYRERASDSVADTAVDERSQRKAEENFIEECEWSAHKEALALCSHQNLTQTVYFLNRDLTFMKEREPVLLKELRKVKTPTRTFQWPTQIWLPKNWIIRRNFQGQFEIIPTVLSNTPTSITTPRADPGQPVFLVEREIVHTTTTRWPMWLNKLHRQNVVLDLECDVPVGYSCPVV
ncbi:uncharacterized protein LOC112453088, partial [Temnothorax curvispinosus]|uniref:Uncharacterized protein LOC112453088 n=1 Tax=Temnothorax curvispinosus TaxID=300111 RepID=A0A6J1PJ48_9HYME